MSDAILDRAQQWLRSGEASGAQLDSICTALIARTERMHRLEEALRQHVITASEYRNEDGDVEVAFFECLRCYKRWNHDEPEAHAPGCLAALQEGGK